MVILLKVNSTVEELVEEIFRNGALPGSEMHLLTERGMSSAVSAFVQKDDKHAVSNMIEYVCVCVKLLCILNLAIFEILFLLSEEKLIIIFACSHGSGVVSYYLQKLQKKM